MRPFASIRPLAGVLALLMLAMAGCAHTRPKRTVANEPPLLSDSDGVGSATVVEGAPAAPVTVADRHPLLRRPRQYYDTTGGGKLTKTAAATILGVPSGIGAEVRQIVSGQPAPK